MMMGIFIACAVLGAFAYCCAWLAHNSPYDVMQSDIEELEENVASLKSKLVGAGDELKFAYGTIDDQQLTIRELQSKLDALKPRPVE